MTRHTILALEVGRYVPSIELALRLAAYFDQPLESIFWLEQEDGTSPIKRRPHADDVKATQNPPKAS